MAQYFNRPVSLVLTFREFRSASSGGLFLSDEIELKQDTDVPTAFLFQILSLNFEPEREQLIGFHVIIV